MSSVGFPGCPDLEKLSCGSLCVGRGSPRAGYLKSSSTYEGSFYSVPRATEIIF